MDCREFRNKHVAFVDDLLAAVEMDAMRRHLDICSGCARQDTRVRRSLMLVRSLPPVEASPDFMLRLNARIAAMDPVSRTDYVQARATYTPTIAAMALAAGLVAVAYMTVETNRYFAPVDSVSVAPALAEAPEVPLATSMANAALAAVPTGIPVWPTVLMVGQSRVRFASMETSSSDIGR